MRKNNDFLNGLATVIAILLGSVYYAVGGVRVVLIIAVVIAGIVWASQ